MKLVKISMYTEPKPQSVQVEDQYYSVNLGNGKRARFRSRKAAQAFLSETSDFLQDQLVELNFLYSDIFHQYRQSWFYFSGRTPESQKSMVALENKIRTKFEAIQYVFDNIYRTNYLSTNTYPFQQIASACSSIIDVSEQLVKLRYKRNDFVERKAVENIAARSRAILINLVSWADDTDFTYQPINHLTDYKQKYLRRQKK